MDWTPPEIERLRALWDEGVFGTEIARRLGKTRNAVIGKAHRLKLASRPSPIKPGGPSGKPRPTYAERKATTERMIATGQRQMRQAVAIIPAPVAPPLPEPEPVVRFLPRAPTACCFPSGTPGKRDFRFCGDAAVVGKPYCLECCRKAYVTVQKTEASQPIVSEFRFRGRASA